MQPLPDLAPLFGTPVPKHAAEASPLDRLLAGFEAHEAVEEQSLVEYRRLLEGVTNPATRLLVEMIVADEERHRAVLGAMARTLRGSLAWQKIEGSLEGDAEPEPLRSALLARTRALIALEHDGIRECRALGARVGKIYDGLFDALIDTIVRDSEKHLALLSHLERRLAHPGT